jgi:hypothetical protein
MHPTREDVSGIARLLRRGFGGLWEFLPWRLWYCAHPKFSSRTISLKPPRKLHTPRSHLPMNRTLSGFEISALPSSPAADGVDSK